MTPLSTARALFFVLIALAWGSRDWVAYHWHESTVDQQIKAAAIGVTIGTLIAARLFKGPIVWAFF